MASAPMPALLCTQLHAHAAGRLAVRLMGLDSTYRHINNITERNYVKVQTGRRVVPTELGITLIRGYQLIDPELCSPQVWGTALCILRSAADKQNGHAD